MLQLNTTIKEISFVGNDVDFIHLSNVVSNNNTLEKIQLDKLFDSLSQNKSINTINIIDTDISRVENKYFVKHTASNLF